jgi:hypothetical protein
MFRIHISDADQLKLKNHVPKSKKFVLDAADKIRLAMANKFVNHFRNGLQQNSFKLKALTRYTVMKKRARGEALPAVPFYGRGEQDTRSVYNLLKVRLNQNNVSVGFHASAMHHSGLKIQDLLVIHQKGDTRIHLPPRDPFQAAVSSFNQTKALQESKKEVLDVSKKANF